MGRGGTTFPYMDDRCASSVETEPAVDDVVGDVADVETVGEGVGAKPHERVGDVAVGLGRDHAGCLLHGEASSERRLELRPE